MFFKGRLTNRSRVRGDNMKNINKVEFELWLQGMEESKAVVDEAVKIAKDYPELNIREVIEKAKECLNG